MLKTITRIGNSQGLILDAALCELTGLRAGDPVNVTVHAGGAVTLTPMRPRVDPRAAGESARELIRRNHALFKRLA